MIVNRVLAGTGIHFNSHIHTMRRGGRVPARCCLSECRISRTGSLHHFRSRGTHRDRLSLDRRTNQGSIIPDCTRDNAQQHHSWNARKSLALYLVLPSFILSAFGLSLFESFLGKPCRDIAGEIAKIRLASTDNDQDIGTGD